MFLYDTPAEREIVNEEESGELLTEIQEKLVYQKGVLALLKQTGLFGPVLERALEDIEDVMEKLKRLS